MSGNDAAGIDVWQLGRDLGFALLKVVAFFLVIHFAGVVINESKLTSRIAAEAVPLQNAFAVLFFVSVGMLFDPAIVFERPLQVAGVIVIVVAGKSLAALLIVLAFRYPLRTALTVSASLAQIGEFSFILAALGVSLKILPPEAQSLILAGALISITLNPLVFRSIGPVERGAQSIGFLARWLASLARVDLARGESPIGGLSGHVVLIGYGRVGRGIGHTLRQSGIPFVVIELNRDFVEQLRRDGIAVIHGDASSAPILDLASPATARMLVVATPDAFQARRMLAQARAVNPQIVSLVRTHSTEEQELLQRAGFTETLMAEKELATRMAHYVTDAYSPAPFG